MSFHENVTGASVHTPFRQVFADATARTGDATVYTAADLNKLAVQVDTGELYRLTDESPTTWTLCGGGGGGPDLTWDPTLEAAGFTAVAGTIHRVDSTVTLTVTLPAAPPDGTLVGVIRIGVGSNNTTVNAVLGNPAFAFNTNMALLVVRYSATDGLWVFESDYLFWLGGQVPQSVFVTGPSGGPTLETVNQLEVLGRDSGDLASRPVERIYLTFAPVITGSGPFPSLSGRLNPYEGVAGLTIEFPTSPSNDDEIAFKEVSGGTNSVTFDGNGANVESPAGTVGATFNSTTARAFYRFRYYNAGAFWALIN